MRMNVTQGKPDHHEGLDIIREVPDDHHLLQQWIPAQQNSAMAEQARTLLTSKNKLPADTHPELTTAIEEYTAAMLELGPAVTRLMGHAFGFKDAKTCPFAAISDESHWLMRLIHYPAPPAATASATAAHGDENVGVDAAADDDGIGCGAHTDYGLLTLLNQDPGIDALQVQNRDGEWIYARPPPDALVVNIGDMTHNMTSGIYKSTNHRVIHTGAANRISVPFFYEPNFDALIKPVGHGGDGGGGDVAAVAASTTDMGAGQNCHETVCYGWHLVEKISGNFQFDADAIVSAAVATDPVVIAVTLTIDPTREAEFLDAMKTDALGSREEPGCRQFDVFKVAAKTNTYMFYEVYDDEEAVAFHKAQDHFKDWMAFQASGGVESIDVVIGGRVLGYDELMTPT